MPVTLAVTQEFKASLSPKQDTRYPNLTSKLGRAEQIFDQRQRQIHTDFGITAYRDHRS